MPSDILYTETCNSQRQGLRWFVRVASHLTAETILAGTSALQFAAPCAGPVSGGPTPLGPTAPSNSGPLSPTGSVAFDTSAEFCSCACMLAGAKHGQFCRHIQMRVIHQLKKAVLILEFSQCISALWQLGYG